MLLLESSVGSKLSVYTRLFHLASREKSGLKNMGREYYFGLCFVMSFISTPQTPTERSKPFLMLLSYADVSSCEVKYSVSYNSFLPQGEASLHLFCTEINSEKSKNQVLGFCVNQPCEIRLHLKIVAFGTRSTQDSRLL